MSVYLYEGFEYPASTMPHGTALTANNAFTNGMSTLWGNSIQANNQTPITPAQVGISATAPTVERNEKPFSTAPCSVYFPEGAALSISAIPMTLWPSVAIGTNNGTPSAALFSWSYGFWFKLNPAIWNGATAATYRLLSKGNSPINARGAAGGGAITALALTKKADGTVVFSSVGVHSLAPAGVGTGITNILDGNWHWVEIYISQQYYVNGSNMWQYTYSGLYVDYFVDIAAIQSANLVNPNTVATPNPYLSLGTTNTMATGYASGFWIDDMTLFYHGKTIDSRVYWPIGRTRIQRRFPSGPSMRASENSMVSSNGSLANWQAASSTDTATYVSTTTSGVTETYHHQPLDFTPNIVFAVAINISAINTMSNTSIYAANRNDSQGTAFNNLKSSTTAITLSNTLSFTNITTLIDTYTEGDAAKTAFIPANYVATGQMEFGIYKS